MLKNTGPERAPARAASAAAHPKGKTQPPTRSSGEWGAYTWIGFSKLSTSKLLRDYRSDAGNTGESKNSGWFAPILKTSVHAELCSGDFQNGLVLLSIVSVFRLWGSSGVYTFSEQSSRFRTAREFRNLLDLPSPWDSLLSCVYNVQYFFEFVNSFMQF